MERIDNLEEMMESTYAKMKDWYSVSDMLDSLFAQANEAEDEYWRELYADMEADYYVDLTDYYVH